MFETLAEQGNLRAMGWLRHYYEFGICGLRVDHARAASLGQRELLVAWLYAKLENADAQDALAEMYANGSGVTPDQTNAVELYRRAAKGGNDDAEDVMGLYYYNGWSGVVPKHTRHAEAPSIKAAEKGNVHAQVRGVGNLFHI
jgi:hypothetical protein